MVALGPTISKILNLKEVIMKLDCDLISVERLFIEAPFHGKGFSPNTHRGGFS
jgi:hypothetical protein